MASRTLAALAVAATLAACAPTRFDAPPGVTEAQFHRDNVKCQAVAKGIVGDSIAFGPPLFVAAAAAGHDAEVRKTHDECMLGEGYTIHHD